MQAITHILNYNVFNSNKTIERTYYLITAILLLGLYWGFTNFLLVVLFIAFRLITTNKTTAGIYLLLFGGVLVGAIRGVYPFIPIYGVMSIIIGFYLLRTHVIKIIRTMKTPFKYLLTIFTFFFITYLYGPHYAYSNDKMLQIVYYGIITLISYTIINSSLEFDNNAIAQILLLSALALLFSGIEISKYSPPNSFFDYTWFRYSVENTYDSYLQNFTGVRYQIIGVYTLLAFAFFLSNNEINNTGYTNKIIFYLMGFQIALSSGTRQAIFGIIILIVFKTLFLYKNKLRLNYVFNLFLLTVLLLLSVGLLEGLNISFLDVILKPNQTATIESISGREYNLLRAYQIISNNFVLGTGLGGFSPPDMAIYPHNIILEILSECGVLGFLALTIILLNYIIKNKITIYRKSANGSYYVLIFLALLIRAFISSDLGENIAIFSFILAWGIKIKNKNNASKYLSL